MTPTSPGHPLGRPTATLIMFGASLALITGVHATVWPAIRTAIAHGYPSHGLWRLTSSLLREAIDPALPWVLGASAIFSALVLAARPEWATSRRPRRLLVVIALGAAHLAAVLGIYVWPLLDRPANDPPNVIFVVVDTLRADHLGFAGYSRPTSPHLDHLATESIIFDNAFTQAPWTSPSVASFLTSKYPGALGYADSKDPAIVEDDATFLAEILTEHGYRTHAIISHTYAGSRLGFDQGMSTFDEDDAKGPLHISSPSVTDKAVTLLNQAQSEAPFFLFLHYFDPHFSYILHEDYDFDPDYQGEIESGAPYGSLIQRARERRFSEQDIHHLRALYDSEIRFTDQHIGRLLQHLKDQGIYDDALIVFTADHGEAFLDRKDRWIGHGKTLFNELTQVPLTIKLPAGKGAGTRVATPVGLIDIVPTLLDLLALPAPRNAGFEGRILPLATPQALAQLEAEPIFAETMARKRWLQSVVHGRWKLIANRQTGNYRLFDLVTDPGERKDIAKDDPGTADELAKTLRAWSARMATERREGAKPTFSDEEIERLRGLGYLP